MRLIAKNIPKLMANKNNINEIIITKSSLPFFRGGLSNLIFFFLIIATCLSVVVFNKFNTATYLRVLMLLVIYLYGILWYLRFVSKIKLGNNSVIFTHPIGNSVIKFEDIKKIKTRYAPAWMAIFISVRIKGSLFPKSFYFVAFSTNIGFMSETKKKLEEMLSQKTEEKKKNEINKN